MDWLKGGDKNTRFFHQKASNRRKKNSMKGVTNGRWVTEETDIVECIEDYYEELFSSIMPSDRDMENVLQHVE